MADVKIEKGPYIFRPGLSEEQKAEVVATFEKYMVGAGQHMQGQARTDAVNKFVEFLESQNAERVQKFEAQIKELHGMEKFERFRTQFYLLLLDVFQGGMYFALSEKAINNEWNLSRVLGLAGSAQPTQTDKAEKK